MRFLTRLGVAAVTGAVVAAGSYAVADDRRPALGPGTITVIVDVEHSTFRPSTLRVAAGTRVNFVVDNHDPINHELILGPPDVHDRHRTGTEQTHPPVDGEVSVAPGERGLTAYTFSEPGTLEFACHLPGHLDYGMRGAVEVVPAT